MSEASSAAGTGIIRMCSEVRKIALEDGAEDLRRCTTIKLGEKHVI